MSESMVPILAASMPRVRKTDPRPSHLAAKKSEKTLSIAHEAVLAILARHPMNDDDLNHYYWSHRETEGWPELRYETPRKRRSDLTKAGRVRRERDGTNDAGEPCTVWSVVA